MKKLFFFAALAAAVLTSCVKTHDTHKYTSPSDAVSFGVYVPKAVTKAGFDSDIINDYNLQHETGFGVFAAWTDNATYGASEKMDFMWNQKVEWNSVSWVYSPVKYWPNEHSTTAVSDHTDRLSFFAYAPHVTANTDGTLAADADWGIASFTANNATGDPKVQYICDSDHDVDLVWGVVGSDTAYSGWSSAGGSTTVVEGKPFLDIVKPNGTPTIKFNFKHALAKVYIDVIALETGAGTSNIATADDSGTRIFIEKLTVEGTNIYDAGTLNLNNTVAGEPLWEVSGAAATQFSESTTLDISSNEKLYIASTPTEWNDSWTLSVKPGVPTDAPVELVSGLVIPHYGSPATHASIDKVTIVYDVITKDTNLVGNASVVKNTIYKDIETVGYDSLEAGKVYNLHLRLGMKTVDLEAEVTNWVDLNSNVDLPANS